MGFCYFIIAWIVRLVIEQKEKNKIKDIIHYIINVIFIIILSLLLLSLSAARKDVA